MKTRSFFEQNSGTYTHFGNVLLPNLVLDEVEQRPIGKYGRLRKRYLKEHHPVLYSELSLSGKLNPHLLEIEEACEGRMELRFMQMAKSERVTEALKDSDQTVWVARMNSIRNRAEEIVNSELIFC